jgi:hypothetical protein
MGLDQYTYRVEKGIIPEGVEVDFELPETQASEDFYWRKNHYLQGWMERLYVEKGGTDSFNCVNLKLTEDDLLRLKKDIEEKNLHKTDGFFFGRDFDYYSEDGYAQRDLKFVEEALESIREEGDDIVYSSWW